MAQADSTTGGHAVTQYQHAAPGLYPSEMSFRALVEAIQDYAIFMLDPNGRVMTWNPGAARIKGYAADEILGQHFSRFYTREAIERRWPQYELEQATLTGRFEDEGWRVRKDGSMFWANVLITALRDRSGRLMGFAKVTRDLTTQREQQEALRQSEERFRLLVEKVRDYAIYLIDTCGRVMSWNDGATRIKGYSRDEILGQHFSLFYTSDDVSAGKPEHELALARRLGHLENEGWRIRKDGSMFWAHVTITAVYDDANELRGFAKVTRDMSERKRLEELEQSSRRMSEFLATLAHELRNPLAPLRNAVSILQLQPELGPALRQCRDMVDRQLAHLTRLVDDLLDIGRITSGKIELRQCVVKLEDIVERSVEAAKPFTDARGQSVDLALAPGVSLYGDPTRLVQVLQNLLHNASKFSPTGSRIEIRARVDGRAAAIQVVDRGCGISEDAIDSVFNLFVQENRQRNPTDSGLGIGLTLCRSIVELHGGSISAASAGAGHGSAFTVRLPIAADALVAAAEQSENAGPGVSARLRVLVVDDNRDSADSLTLLIQMKGHDARAAYHAAQAIAAARHLQPDLVLVDLAMPDIDGFALLRSLRELAPPRRVLYAAMTGFGQEADRERTRAAGFDTHLLKPITMPLLNDVLAKAAEKPLLDG